MTGEEDLGERPGVPRPRLLPPKALPTVLWAALAVPSVALVALGAFSLRAGAATWEGPPVADMLRAVALRSVVYARDGSVLANLHAEEDRTPARLEELPDVLLHAVVDVEDRSFFHHPGVDPRAVVRALVANVRAGRIVQGGSTITQQLVRNRLVGSERDLERKLREAALALRLEHELDKRAILERYINTVYFGHGAYGVRAAAERFYGKAVSELDGAEAALLAGLIADPARSSPFTHPEVAWDRRASALGRMVDAGHLHRAAAVRLAVRPLPAAPHDLYPPDDHFVEEVKRGLLRDRRLGDTYQERYQAVFRGGLSIHTTLDPALQAAATEAVARILPPSPYTAALVALDAGSGEVRALVGGPNFEQAQYNLVTQGVRQPGSAFKAITMAAALEAGYSPLDRVNASRRCSFWMPKLRQYWHVRNYDGSRSGVTTLHDALVRSLNCGFARLVLAVGTDRVIDMANRLGVTRPLPRYAPITLGAGSVSPLEMATVFATFAAEGVRHDPVFVRRVEGPDGRTLFEEASPGRPVLDPEVARTLTSVLADVVRKGTGRRADIGRPAAGKTGTSEEWRDAWFCGYTPQLAAVVWMGSPEGEIPMRDVEGRPVVGGRYPAMIWADFMRQALKDAPVVGFTPPDPTRWPRPGVVRTSGRVAPRPPKQTGVTARSD